MGAEDVTTDDVLAELAEYFAVYEPQPGDFSSRDVLASNPALAYWSVRDKIEKLAKAGTIKYVGKIGSLKYYRKV